MRSFSCSRSSSPSSPFAYSAGRTMSRSMTSFTRMPSWASFCVIICDARSRTSARRAANTSRTV